MGLCCSTTTQSELKCVTSQKKLKEQMARAKQALPNLNTFCFQGKYTSASVQKGKHHAILWLTDPYYEPMCVCPNTLYKLFQGTDILKHYIKEDVSSTGLFFTQTVNWNDKKKLILGCARDPTDKSILCTLQYKYWNDKTERWVHHLQDYNKKCMVRLTYSELLDLCKILQKFCLSLQINQFT